MDIKIFEKRKSFRKGGFHTNPNIGWQIILVLAFGVVVALFAFGFFLFRKANREFQAPSFSEEARGKLVDRARLDQALEYYAEKAADSAEILSLPAKVVDPSI